MVGKQKERPVATRPKPNSHSATNHDGELCVPDSDTGIVVPYSALPMCQLADALRFGHVGACLPTIWYVPVHLYHRGIDPSERSHRAAYCLQQRCLVRPCVVFTKSASHPSERWHPLERWYPSERWHQGAGTEAFKKRYFRTPCRRDGTGCDRNDINPRVSATAPGQRGGMRAQLLSHTNTTGTCVVPTLFTRGNESSCFHLIGIKNVLSQPSSQHTYLVRYMPSTAPQVAAAATLPLVAAATLPLVSEEVASAPAPSDMAQRMMCVCRGCVSTLRYFAAFSRCIVVPYSAAPMCLSLIHI